MANVYQNQIFQGLGTLAVVVPEASDYMVDIKSQIPSITQGSSPSGLVITIKNGATTKYTGAAGASGAQYIITCAAGDTINIVFSSANAVDGLLNAVKSAVSISEAP